MTAETVAVPKTIPIDRSKKIDVRTRIKDRLKQEATWFGILYLLPPVLDYIGKRYPLRDKTADRINEKLEEHELEPIEGLTKVVPVEYLGDLPDVLGNMPNVAKLKFMISYGGPKIREFRRTHKKKGTIFSFVP